MRGSGFFIFIIPQQSANQKLENLYYLVGVVSWCLITGLHSFLRCKTIKSKFKIFVKRYNHFGITLCVE